ncbi:MAG: hypothetical protein PHH28_01230 [Desulfuromonadaceae bacterium]|nr:hypothetical protein [Desulfuromonadaceae bacterium]
MSNLLLITDVARLRKVFGRLTEDKNIRLRVVNNLEKGGEEIVIEKPDVVFVQTHLSGLSADILIMHLKKQLGRKRSRFVLLAAPDQTNDTILKPYQGWLDTSADDSQMLSELHRLLATLLNKQKKNGAAASPGPAASPEPVASSVPKPQPVSAVETSALLGGQPVSDATPPQEPNADLQFPVATPATAEPSLEEQGITYAPRPRLTVYSEFNSSFDSAVSSTPEPEALDQETPSSAHEWNVEDIDTIETKPTRPKRSTFLLWLVPVIIGVIAVTYLQQRPASTTASTAAKAPAATIGATPTPSVDQDKISDKAVLTDIAGSRDSKSTPPAVPAEARPSRLPDFIPQSGLDKTFSAANPGWERYKGKVTEFKVLREANAIKAIQVIDRGGQGVPEAFMRNVLHQVTKTPDFSIETSEKKEGYLIQRGKVAKNIKVVYYRDENGGRLRAFVLTWL